VPSVTNEPADSSHQWLERWSNVIRSYVSNDEFTATNAKVGRTAGPLLNDSGLAYQVPLAVPIGNNEETCVGRDSAASLCKKRGQRKKRRMEGRSDWAQRWRWGLKDVEKWRGSSTFAGSGDWDSETASPWCRRVNEGVPTGIYHS